MDNCCYNRRAVWDSVEREIGHLIRHVDAMLMLDVGFISCLRSLGGGLWGVRPKLLIDHGLIRLLCLGWSYLS
jgi:hypothetical protein